MASNAETFVVKLNYGGQLRRFPIPKGISFNELRGQVIQLLELHKDTNVILKYSDDEGDLITIASDLELNSALVPEKILRLTVIDKNAVVYPPIHSASISDAMDIAPVASGSPQGGEVFRAFPKCGRGAPFHPYTPGFSQHHRADHHHHRGGFGGCGGFGPHRGDHPFGHHRAFGPYGPRMHHMRRAEMTPEELHEFKKEYMHAHKELKRVWRKTSKCMKKEWKQGFRCATGTPWGANTPAGANERFVARLAKDVTIPDGTNLAPGTPFVKTWCLRNEGAEWPAGCVLRFLKRMSDNLGNPETVPVPGPVAPNSEVEVSVNLVAPGKPGRYTGYWRMCTPDGCKFGQRVRMSVVVPGTSSSSSSSDSDQEADKYEALVDTVLATGLCAKRHRVFRMLQKTNGDANLVCEKLTHKEEKHARKAMKKHMKL